MADVCQVREFLLEKAIFQLEDEHGAASDVVVAKVPPTARLSSAEQMLRPLTSVSWTG